MKLSELQGGSAPREGPPAGQDLPYPCSEFAEPPITEAEARAVDLGRDTCICRWHGGQLTHLSVEGQVLYCPIGNQLWRYTKLLSDFLRPLR